MKQIRQARDPSIHDVARAAGVSIATVSYALRGSQQVAGATRERVARAAAALGYQPNRLARGLRTQQTHMVGMLVAPLRNPTVASLVEGASAVFDEAGYSAVLAPKYPSLDDASPTEAEIVSQEARGLVALRQLQVDGFLLQVPTPQLLAEVPHLAAERPVVLTNTRWEPQASHGRRGRPATGGRRRPEVVAAGASPALGAGPASDHTGHTDEACDAGAASALVDAVVMDERRAGYDATRHLLQLGHRRVAFLRRGLRLWPFEQRLAGYRHALAEAGFPVDPALVLVHEPPEAPAAGLVERLLSLPDPPSAAFVAHNLVALRLVTALQDAGVAVPDRLALVLSVDEDWMQVVRPRLTTIAAPSREVGATAARLLLRRLRGEADRAPQVVTLRAPLLVRESCGAGRQGAPPAGSSDESR